MNVGQKIVHLTNDNNENVLHLSTSTFEKPNPLLIVANDQSVKNSNSIAGNQDMTLFDILDLLITKCGSAGRQLAFKADKNLGQTPLHYAFKSGNIEVALWIIQLVRKEQGYEAYAEVINARDMVI